MYGLVKIASQQNVIIMEKHANILDDIQNQINQRGMSEEQYREFTDKLKKQYGHDTDYLFASRPTRIGGSYAIPDPKQVEMIKNSPAAKDALGIDRRFRGSGSTLVNSVPLEDIVLHETGHILDPNILQTSEKAQKYHKLAGLAGLGAFAAPFLPENKYITPKVKTGLSLGSAAAAGMAQGRASAYTNKGEDAANEFVKKHWEKELGSPDAANKKFDESLLPKGRKSYGNAVKNGVGHALGTGLTSAAILAGKALSKKKK